MTSEDVQESCQAVKQVLDFKGQVGDEKLGLKEFVCEEAGDKEEVAYRRKVACREEVCK